VGAYLNVYHHHLCITFSTTPCISTLSCFGEIRALMLIGRVIVLPLVPHGTLSSILPPFPGVCCMWVIIIFGPFSIIPWFLFKYWGWGGLASLGSYLGSAAFFVSINFCLSASPPIIYVTGAVSAAAAPLPCDKYVCVCIYIYRMWIERERRR
jgi:hypothetical protein